jgi:hypothetical protein
MTAKRLAAAACQHGRGHRSEAWLCPQVGNGRLELAGGGSGDRLCGAEVAAGPRQVAKCPSWSPGALSRRHTRAACYLRPGPARPWYELDNLDFAGVLRRFACEPSGKVQPVAAPSASRDHRLEGNRADQPPDSTQQP